MTNKGSILITTLWIMAILALLAMGIGFRASLEVRLSKYNMDKLQARYLAKAGIEKAKEYLSQDINEEYENRQRKALAKYFLYQDLCYWSRKLVANEIMKSHDYIIDK